MASEPRPDFSEADGALLSSIARMASDALEKEYQALRASKVAAMQRSAAALIRADHVGRANDRTSHDGGASNSSSDRSQQSGLDLDPHIFEKSCRHLHRVLGADAVAAIDISSFSIEHQKALDSPVVHSAYPQTPWINGLATPGGPLTPPPEDSCPSPPDLASSPALQRPVWQTHRSNRSQSASICQQLSSPDGDEVCMIEPAQGAQLIAFCAGPEHSPPEADGGAERAICSWLTKWRREHRAARPTVYYTAVDSDTETEEGPSLDAKNPLSSLVPSDTTMYMAMPAFDDREQPTFMLLVSFIQPTQLDEADRLFLESVGAILYGSIISRRAQAVDRAQLRFIQQVQHELRTRE